MAIRNPYYDDREDEYAPMRRDAIVDQLGAAPPPMSARPRTPTRTPQQTREMLSGPGGRTQAVDEPDYSNAFTGTPDAPREDLYTPSVAEAATGAQPRTESSNRQRGYSLLDAYDDPYERRMEGPGGVLSNAAKYAQTGASVGSAFAGVGAIPGAIIGGIGGAIGGAFSKNAKSAMTDFSIEDARAIISQAYKDAFGRDITPQELDEAIRGQGWEPGDKWFGEAPLAYVLDQYANNAAAERAARGPETTAAPAAVAPAATGALGSYANNLEGFAMERFADPSGRGNNTIKYQVGRVLSRHPPTAEGLAAAAEELRGMGIDVTQGGRNGDLLEFGADVVDDQGNPIGAIDVGRGFGAAGSGWAWQPTGGGGAAGDAPGDIAGAYEYLKATAHPGMSRAEMEAAVARAFGNVPGFEKAYAGDVVIGGRKIDLITDFEGANPQWSDNLNFVPLHGGGGGGGVIGAGAMAGSGVNLAPGVSLASPLGNSNVLQEIMAEIQRLQRGQPPRAAIVDQLGAGA